MTPAVLRDMYQGSRDDVRRRFAGDAEAAGRYYRRYIEFVTGLAPARGDTRPTRLLDLGCGAGWSSFGFAREGFAAVGVDLGAEAVETPPESAGRLSFAVADAARLPFADDSFDVVASYQTIEHVESPGAALGEMVRVCRRGGVVCVVGPNLLSPWLSLRRTFFEVWKNRPFAAIFVRRAGAPRNPFGATFPEALAIQFVNLFRIAGKTLSPAPRFTKRKPDSQPPFGGDNDACYVCNPIDLVRFFRANGCRVVRNGAPGRPRWTALLAGGAWVAARVETAATARLTSTSRGGGSHA